MSNEQQLLDLRARIDELDGQLLQMITTRAELAKAVAAAKGGEATDYYRPEREAQVLRKIISQNRGPLSDEEMARLFREIMSACLALQQPLNVGFLGPEGTFTHAAVQKHFGRSVQALPMGTIDDVFREVEAEACHYGVVPVENSIEGVVNHTLDMFINSPLRICGEVELRIHHHLLGKAANPDGLERVYGHEQALAQCRRWLNNHLAKAARCPVASNAEAARRAAAEPGTAAIADSHRLCWRKLSHPGTLWVRALGLRTITGQQRKQRPATHPTVRRCCPTWDLSLVAAKSGEALYHYLFAWTHMVDLLQWLKTPQRPHDSWLRLTLRALVLPTICLHQCGHDHQVRLAVLALASLIFPTS